MAKYTKSHTNYVISEMSQFSNNGNIYERDITTIGGRDSFSRGQIPVYRSGNFVITVNAEDKKTAKIGSTNVWVNNNGSNNNIWTLETMDENVIKDSGTTTEIVEPNRNIHNLSDFAYYGSCKELFRASVNDIARKFPGELYIPDKEITEYVRYYYSGETQEEPSGMDIFFSKKDIGKVGLEYDDRTPFTGLDGVRYSVSWSSGMAHVGDVVTYNNGTDNPLPLGKLDGGKQLYAVSNPLGINAVFDDIDDEYNPLKYLRRNNTYRKYELIDASGFTYDIEAQFLIGGSFPGSATTSFEIRDLNGSEYATHQYDDATGSSVSNDVIESSDQAILDGGPDIVIGPGAVSGRRLARNNALIRPIYDLENSDIPTSGKTDMHDLTVVSSRTMFDYDEEILSKACPGDKIGEFRLILTQNKDLFEVNQETSAISATSAVDMTGLAEVVKSESIIRYRSSGGSEGSTTMTKYSEAIFNIYLGDNGVFYYLVDYDDFNERELLGAHIRPKQEYFNDFYNGLDLFEQLLINPFTNPSYVSTFNVVEEDDYGDYSHLEVFRFPTDEGGYNIDTNSIAYSSMIEQMTEIGEYYDIRYSDVIWRALTHEAIKNLDWTIDKRDKDDIEETHASAYGRVDKTLRTMGRFFDNIMSYTDNLRTTNTVTYDKDNNLSDAFVKDKLNECGWDTVQITPFELNEYQETTDGDVTFLEWEGFGYKDTMQCEMFNLLPDVNNKLTLPLTRRFYRDNKTDGVYPYYVFSGSVYNWKYVDETVQCGCEKWENIGGDYVKTDDSEHIQRAYKRYGIDKMYTYPEINTEFMRRLIINTNGIVSKKGTIEGIESLLAMFGMKSKRFTKHLKDIGYSGETPFDYDVREYVAKVNECVVDQINSGDTDYYFDKLNQYKNISYNDSDYINGINIPYIGLPVKYYTDSDKNIRYLYPFFNKDKTYDGDPYYQMYGGWQQRLPYTYDINDNIVAEPVVGNAFHETIKEIMSVETIGELINIPYYALNDNDIYKVEDTDVTFAIVDGVIYSLSDDEQGNANYKYFTVTVDNSSVIIGQTLFEDTVTVSNPYSNGGVKKYILSNGNLDGNVIKVYVDLTGDNTVIKAYSNVTSVSRVSVFNGQKRKEEGYTDYFVIRDAYYAGEMSDLGWSQLKVTDPEYYIINNLRNVSYGNNPHSGRLNYDNGSSYVTQFSKLFRYSIDNNLFSERLYEELGEGADEVVNSFGFDLYDSNESQFRNSDCYGSYGMVVGNGIDENSTHKVAVECDTLIEQVDASGNTYGYVMKNAEHDVFNGEDTGALIGEKVINTKCFDIDFNIYVEEIGEIEQNSQAQIPQETYLYTKDAQKQIKYIEETILPYLNQMIPSSCICRINYKLNKMQTVSTE